jgi:hypothetical protein
MAGRWFHLPVLDQAQELCLVVKGGCKHYIKARCHWADQYQYNYVLSAGLDSGTAISAVVIFLVIALPGVSVTWWGNTVYQRSA